MNKFEDNIPGLVSKEDWLQVGYDVERPNDPTGELFGNVRTDNLVAYWESIAAEYNIPAMAQFHAFDTEAQKTIRIPVDVHNIEKGLIKVKIDQSERLRALMGRGVNNESVLYERVLRDGANLAEQVVTRAIVSENELLATGKVTINENNLNLTVDYGVPSGNLTKVIDFGAGADTPVDEQLLGLREASASAGVPINGMYLGSKALNALRKNASIQKAVNGSNMVGQLVKMNDIRAYLNDEFGIARIIVNDNVYSLPLTMGNNGRPTVTSNRVYPDGKITFFHADAKLGDGLWGDPPEVSASNYMDVASSTESPYVFISQYTEHDPAVVWTKASALFMPVLYNPAALYVATTISTPAGA